MEELKKTFDKMGDNMAKVWYLTPDKENIQIINIPKNPDLECYYKLLKCDCLDCGSVIDWQEGIGYFVYCDDLGCFKNEPNNECARRFFKNIDINFGTFNGWFLVIKVDMNNNQTLIDMDNITPKQFIKKFNNMKKSINKKIRENMLLLEKERMETNENIDEKHIKR